MPYSLYEIKPFTHQVPSKLPLNLRRDLSKLTPRIYRSNREQGAMTKRITVAKITDLEPGSCLSVEADGIGVALFNVNGRIYALDNTCPHAGGPLGEGTLAGEVVECPWHGWRYSVTTGERLENPEFKVACYEVQVTGDLIQVSVPANS